MNVLGTEYKIFYEPNNSGNPKMEGADGYCETEAHEIHIARDMFEGESKDPKVLKNIGEYGKKVLRHEMVHAFITESGLSECCEWARSEELVDWIARQFTKMEKCFKEAKIN